MTDEELRKFCLEQAVLIITRTEKPRTMGLGNTKSISLYELSEILFEYIKTGKKINVPVYLCYLM